MAPEGDRRFEPIDGRTPEPARSWLDLAREAVLVLPNLVKLIARVIADPRVPMRRKALLGAVLMYVVSPIDLIPDVIVGVGWIDDVVLVALAVDHLLDGTDAEVLRELWDGSEDSLDLVRSVASWGADIVPSSFRKRLPR